MESMSLDRFNVLLPGLCFLDLRLCHGCKDDG